MLANMEIFRVKIKKICETTGPVDRTVLVLWLIGLWNHHPTSFFLEQHPRIHFLFWFAHIFTLDFHQELWSGFWVGFLGGKHRKTQGNL